MLSVAVAVLAGYSVAFFLGGGAVQRGVAPNNGPRSSPLAMGNTEDSAAAAVTQTPVVIAAAPQFEVFEVPNSQQPVASPPAVSEPAAVEPAPRATATARPPTAVPATATTVPPTAVPATASAQPATATAQAVASPSSAPSAPVVAGGEVFLEDTFDSPATGWPVRTSGPWLADYVDGQYETRLTGDSEAGVAYPMKSGDYRMAVDVSVETGAAGMLFLYSQPSSYYWAGVGADGSFGVERIDGDQVIPVIAWQPQAAVPRDGKPAHLTIQRQGDILMVMVGDAHLAHFPVPSGSWENRYGFVVSPRDGVAVARYDNLRGERFP